MEIQVAVIGFIGVFFGAIVTGLFDYWQTRKTIEETRRKERQEYLISRMESLIQAVSEYEEYLGEHDYSSEGDKLRHARIIGKAIAACLAVSDFPTSSDIPIEDDVPPKVKDYRDITDVPDSPGDKVHRIHRLTYIANQRMTRNFVTEKDKPEEAFWWGHYHDRNRAALDHAIKRLAQLIAKNNSERQGRFSQLRQHLNRPLW